MLIQNCWYVAAWDTEVLPNTPFARTIINVPIVLWRDANGVVIAFEDRCCHRGAPLSMGRQENGLLRCMYHGLLFDATGHCVSIPAQNHIPDKLKVKKFPTVEKHRWIWIWMGDPEKADTSKIPETPWLDHPEWRSLDGYLHYETSYLLIADNLLDFSHLPFLHPTSVGGSADYASVLPKVEKLQNGVRLSKWVLNTEPPEYSAKFANYSKGAKVDRWMNYDFLMPGILLMDSGMKESGVEDSQNGSIAFRGCQALTPETNESTHYFFGHPHNFLINQPEVTRAIHNSILTALEEDRAMISAQARSLKLDPSFKMTPLTIDGGVAQFRRLVKDAVERELASHSVLS